MENFAPQQPRVRFHLESAAILFHISANPVNRVVRAGVNRKPRVLSPTFRPLACLSANTSDAPNTRVSLTHPRAPGIEAGRLLF